MAKRKTKYPATLVVKYEEDGDSSYFLSATKIVELAELGEKIEVGVYDLREIRTLSADPILG